MIVVNLDFKCALCSHQVFFVMPLKEKVNNDFINSNTKYNLQCKKCGKHYILNLTVKAI